jgi:truncated hemoglobin YjbI
MTNFRIQDGSGQDNGFVDRTVKLYRAIGGAAGCRALAVAFYGHVVQDPILRPLFPSTFTCAIESFSAFLVQFLGGEAEATQRRWWLSLRESHERFSIGARERNAWLRAMNATLADETVISDAATRNELFEFFRQSSAYIANEGSASPLKGELAPLWDEQVALDDVVAEINSGKNGKRSIELLESPVLQARFARSPAVHATVLALAATSRTPSLRQYAADQIRTNPSLIQKRYKGGRSLLYDAAASGNVALVELLLDLGAGKTPEDGKVLYGVGNECSAASGDRIVRLLLERTTVSVNAAHGAKRCTALHMAARRGNAGVIEALLDGGADIEARDSAGDTPLRRAVNCNQLEAARLLLARDADRHSTGSRSLTPALAARTPEMKQLFL